MAGRVLLVGDAAGYVDALTGEGIAVSLACARALVDCVAARSTGGLRAALAAGSPGGTGRSPRHCCGPAAGRPCAGPWSRPRSGCPGFSPRRSGSWRAECFFGSLPQDSRERAVSVVLATVSSNRADRPGHDAKGTQRNGHEARTGRDSGHGRGPGQGVLRTGSGSMLTTTYRVSDEIRFVQLTPPGSACSIALGHGITDCRTGFGQGTADGGRRRRRRAGRTRRRGVEVSDVQDFPWGSFVFFNDPDGNGWAVQEVPPR